MAANLSPHFNRTLKKNDRWIIVAMGVLIKVARIYIWISCAVVPKNNADYSAD